MIDLSKISRNSFLGKLLRIPLKLIPANFILPIFQGANKGLKWIKKSGVNGYWAGSYELKKQSAMVSYLREGMVCYDVGAHSGYYSLIFSKRVDKAGKVYAFEPNPFNLSCLLKNLQLNKIENVKVFPIALGRKEDFSLLVLDSSESHLDKGNEEKFFAPVFRIDDLISQAYISFPDIIKIDAEGAELAILQGMQDLLSNKPIILFIALDNKEKRKKIFSFLTQMGYKILDLEEREVSLKKIDNMEEIIAKKETKELN